MRDAYISALYELAAKDENVYALVADNGIIVYDEFRKRFSDRFINLGISEANMIGVSSAMALNGLKPYVYSQAAFITSRAFEFIRNDICSVNANVKIIGLGTGFTYGLYGVSHHSIDDIALMRVLPNITIISPVSPIETKKATHAISDIDGPVYMRISTGCPEIYNEDYEFILGKGITLSHGNDLTIIATGTIMTEAVEVCNILREKNISVRLINIHTIKPIDKEIIINAALETKNIVTLEEHSVIGGLGDAVGEVLLTNGIFVNHFLKLGLKDSFVKGYGSYDYLKKVNGLKADSIASQIEQLFY